MLACSAAALFMGEYRVAAMIATQAGLSFCLTINAAEKAKETRRIRLVPTARLAYDLQS